MNPKRDVSIEALLASAGWMRGLARALTSSRADGDDLAQDVWAAEDMSAADIARTLGIPSGTVRWRLSEAVARLRARLDDGPGGRRA